MATKTAKKRPATLKDLHTHELAMEEQTQLWEVSKFQALCSLQDEILLFRINSNFEKKVKGLMLRRKMISEMLLPASWTRILET